MTKKILILKNDRGGDLFTSTKLISSLISLNSNTTIYLSELNHGFSFLFKSVLWQHHKVNHCIYKQIPQTKKYEQY